MSELRYLSNLAGMDEDKANAQCRTELEAAGIKVYKMPFTQDGEVSTNILGDASPWVFKRAWRYWVAEGPGIPPDVAEELHAEHGQYVRVDGHCGCPSPLEWFKGFAVGMYHIDTIEGLAALAQAIEKVRQNTGDEETV